MSIPRCLAERNGGTGRAAILLIGPTGAGKTPLGDALEAGGFLGRRCVHFDFGRNLRDAAGGSLECGLTDDETGHIRHVLKHGLLLEDGRFGLALKILAGFVREHGIPSGGLLVINGLPRHEGQARGLDKALDVRLVVHLCAAPEVVFERIRRNSGGDRGGRTDDTPAEIAGKVMLFEKKTAPLLDLYKARGIRVSGVTVGVETTAQDMIRELETALGDQADAHQG